MSLSDIAIPLGSGGVIVVFGYILLRLLRQHRKDSAFTANLDDVLSPWLYKAIVAGQHVALSAFEYLNQEVSGADKKAVADSVYLLLPDAIKLLVTPLTFESMVEQAYGEAHDFIMQNESYLHAQIDPMEVQTDDSHGHFG